MTLTKEFTKSTPYFSKMLTQVTQIENCKLQNENRPEKPELTQTI